MIDDTPETTESAEKFDFSTFPKDTLFHERRHGSDRRSVPGTGPEAVASHDGPRQRVTKERRTRKERRRRIDPTTYEKRYTEDELEFMNAMQQFKIQTCKSFPTYGDVLQVASGLGYSKAVPGTGDEQAGPDKVGAAPTK